MSEVQKLSLKSLLAPNKVVDVDFPGYSGFTVKVAYLSREALVNLRKKCTVTTFKNRQAGEDLDDKKFLELYTKAAVKGWSGLKLAYLEKLAPIEVGDNDPEAELPFSDESALELMKASSDFDAFISNSVTDLENFPSSNPSK